MVTNGGLLTMGSLACSSLLVIRRLYFILDWYVLLNRVDVDAAAVSVA